MKKRARSVRCPICKTIVLRKEAEFPFCSERCRLIDLGKWASGAYVISAPLKPSDEMVDLDAIEQAEEHARSAGDQPDSSRTGERNK
jgi:endogenous inhibitor of DNA gyrase (YacG/DUF329 family)